MPKITQKEREMAQKHPIAFPIIAIAGLLLIIVIILGYFLYQTVGENTQLKQKYQDNTNPVDNFEDSQGQQLENNLEGL